MTPLPEAQNAVVAVGVSTLWASPQAPRPCDEAAVADIPDPAAWVAAMTDDERRDLNGRTLSQLLLGDPVLVEEISNGWARVVAVDQARSGLDPRGYPGWVPAAHLAHSPAEHSRADSDGGGRYVVDALVSTLRDEPRGNPALAVVVGTELAAVGRAQDGFVPVGVAGQPRPLWARLADLAVPGAAPAADQVLELARRFAGVPYVWGGTSPYGLDCSGLVYLIHRRFGVVVPRDTDDQETACESVGQHHQRPGHLAFFRDNGGRIHHVGIIEAPGQLLHASGSAGRVQSEPLDGELAATLHSVGRPVS